MALSNTSRNGAIKHWILVRADSSGQHTAQAVGLPDVVATAGTREEALQRVRDMLEICWQPGSSSRSRLIKKTPCLAGSVGPIRMIRTNRPI